MRSLFQVEEAALHDVPQLCTLLSLLFTQEADFHPDTARQSAGLSLIIQQPEFGQILLVRKGSAVVGMVNLLFTPSPAHGGPAALLEDLIVHPSHRRLGIASALLRHAIALAQVRGAAHITLLTDRSNQPAIQFYLSHGFNLCQYEVSRLPLAG